MKDEKFQNNNAGDERYFSTSDYSQNNDAGWTSDHERSSYDQQFGSNHMDDRETDDWSQRGSYESGPEVPKKSRKKIGIMIGCGVAAAAQRARHSTGFRGYLGGFVWPVCSRGGVGPNRHRGTRMGAGGVL